MYDYVHPGDFAKVKDQIFRIKVNTGDQHIDDKKYNKQFTSKVPKTTKTFNTLSDPYNGNRRSFICRMKKKVYGVTKENAVDSKHTDSSKSLWFISLKLNEND